MSNRIINIYNYSGNNERSSFEIFNANVVSTGKSCTYKNTVH